MQWCQILSHNQPMVRNSVFSIRRWPYVLAVVSIRGTLSLEDCLTDFMCEPADINDWMTSAPSSGRASFDDDTPEVQLASRGDTITAHAGILEAAKAVVKDMQVGLPSMSG